MISNHAGSADERFLRFREMLIKSYGQAVYKSWFEDLMLDDAGVDAVTLSTASDLKRDRLDQQFKPALIRVWSENVYPIRKINIVKRAMQAQSARVSALAPSAAGAAKLGVIRNGFAGANGHAVNGHGVNGQGGNPDEARLLRVDEISTPLDARQTFDSFAVGKSNEVAVAAAHQIFVEGAPREILYLFGPSGVGKSHLLQAAGNAFMQRHPLSRVVYLTHDKIQKGCVGALRSQSTMSFQRDLLSNDLVMIDDIHMLAGKAGTLGELLVLINALVGAGIRPYEVNVAGPRIDIAMTPDAKRAFGQEALADSIEVVRRRIDPAGNKEVLIQPQGADRIVVQAPGDNDPEALKQIINRTGQLSFHRVDASASPEDAQAGLLPPGRIVVPIAEVEGGGALVTVWLPSAEVQAR